MVQLGQRMYGPQSQNTYLTLYRKHLLIPGLYRLQQQVSLSSFYTTKFFRGHGFLLCLPIFFIISGNYKSEKTKPSKMFCDEFYYQGCLLIMNICILVAKFPGQSRRRYSAKYGQKSNNSILSYLSIGKNSSVSACQSWNASLYKQVNTYA